MEVQDDGKQGETMRRAVRSAFSAGIAYPGIIGVLACLLASAAMTDAEVAPAASQAWLEEAAADPELLMERARAASGLLSEVEGYYDEAVAPLERVLRRQGADEKLARRIALALVREGNRTGVDPRLLTAIMLVENPALDSLAQSPVGARGLMQIMPAHRGHWRGCPPTLATVDANICYGARIFAWNLRASGGDVNRALLRYNGCVRGTNTPNCQMYPRHVYTRVTRVHRWGAAPTLRAAAP